jgi:cytochrome c peroxidase
MLRLPVLKLLTAMAAFAGFACDHAHAAAQVGETHSLVSDVVHVPQLDQLKDRYRRPESIPFPPQDPYTPEKALLGRMLYYDTRLSNSGTLACVSCHNPGFGYSDGQVKATGNDTKRLDRRSPGIINTAWGVLFMWDGRITSLEEQALSPIRSPSEMNLPLDRMTDALNAISGYRTLFERAFPHQQITPVNIASAIATYERTIISDDAPFDAWIDGDETAISDAAKKGFELFNTKAHCASCHSGWNFTDDGFHDIGLPGEDVGRGLLMPRVIKMQHAFKTPSLREASRRQPYMHDGSLPSLEAVVAYYNQGGINRASRSELIAPLGLSQGDQDDIVAFLRTLSGHTGNDSIPNLPR